ncbi:hypothetical protein UFOVP267_45 [uncultured Caudovirales phage]|uniref:Uncharacterized protein n=1 Tax=uncultured Caudovirales phage TaxID=2100421 RepID=A0A6J5LMQ9_9CAUD|nr:hypothetical protein UFOVP267_45 [uncultured Caudovirales phage]
MPTLADIYSAINTAKRKGADFVQNPVTSLQQMLGNAEDRAGVYNQQMYQAGQGFGAPARGQQATPEQLAAQQNLAESWAEAYNPTGMTVWHGSPHIFQRFDLGKIGTGEGAQMYGRGFYTAQDQGVAKRFTPRDPNFENNILKKYDQAQNANDYASAQIYEDFLTHKTPEEIASSMKEAGFAGKDASLAQKAFDYAKSLYQNQIQGSLYKVDLPDTHIRRMLDWDAPLKNQPKPIRELAKSLGVDLNDLGGDLMGKIGKGDKGKQILQDAGIPGIKYFDEMSRGSQKNVRNFVVFDPNHLTVLERNSQPIK